jgi:hypothetical protein
MQLLFTSVCGQPADFYLSLSPTGFLMEKNEN